MAAWLKSQDGDYKDFLEDGDSRFLRNARPPPTELYDVTYLKKVYPDAHHKENLAFQGPHLISYADVCQIPSSLQSYLRQRARSLVAMQDRHGLLSALTVKFKCQNKVWGASEILVVHFN
jgi:hypothetical protein